MKKNIKAIQNIQFLKWCKETGEEPQWNLIWALGNKTMADYEAVVNLIPYIMHLKPPASISTPSSVSSYAKYHHAGVYNAHEQLHAFLEASVANWAYFFSFEPEMPYVLQGPAGKVMEAIQSWQSCYQETDLFYMDEKEGLVIWDFRSSFTETRHIFNEQYRAVYLACEQVTTPKHIRSVALEKYNIKITETELQVVLSWFLDVGLMIKSENYFLSLAVPTYGYSPNVAILEKLGNWVDGNTIIVNYN